MDPFQIIIPEKPLAPIIVSVPHCGAVIPDNLKSQYHSTLIDFIDDTDWFVDQLYAFVTQMGITMIKSVYSRWVIDLNRSPESLPLYDDGRIITGLVPTTNFLGDGLYQNDLPDQKEIEHRKRKYYQPYHDQLRQLLIEMRKKFSHVLLWDAHSIRQEVPSLFKGKFPDLTLGDNDGKSAATDIITSAINALTAIPLKFTHNHPFKGGFITRNYGRPDRGIHALQLEMTKINYMDNDEISYDQNRAKNMQSMLENAFLALTDTLSTL